MKRKIHILLNTCLALLLSVTAAFSAFDPVNDDTDIFLANPNITAQRPNVLIILDNTANWNTPFDAEKNALISVISSLNDSFNVGLMMMPETGSPNDSVDGGYVRFHVRQMITANKNALTTMIGAPGAGLDKLGDKGNNATHGAALYEAYLYYAGLASVASYGKVKTDHDGTTDPLLSPLAGNHALPANPTASSLYRSPIVDGCQKNFIILISNGKADNNVTEGNTMESRITALTGSNAIIPLTPNGRQSNWSDEMSRYMATTDVYKKTPDTAASTGIQNVFTYVVEIYPTQADIDSRTSPDLAWSAVMESTAINGKGKYFIVAADAGGSAIINALNAIFSEVQAVNSVFASTTLPVSVNVRGTNLNQVYIGVFRPDANKAPRWLGNLKMYNLAFNSVTQDVFLADASAGPPPATGIAAQDATSGFVKGAATSFWTVDSTYWGFRDSSLNGVGGISDKPDGDLVEKGGVAQQIRLAYAAAEGATTPRSLYTCTNGGYASPGCLPLAGFSLLNTPFSTANTDITNTALALDSRAVFPLTAYATQSVTTVTDRLGVTLNNGSGSSISVTLSNGGSAVAAISSLNTNVAIAMSSYSGSSAGTQATGATGSIVKAGTGSSTCTATFSANVGAQFLVSSVVTLSGFTGSNQNGNVTLTAVGTNTITWACSGSIASAAGGPTGTATVVTFPSTTITGTSPAVHGLAVNDQIIISGATPTSLNNTFTVIAVPTTTTFKFSLPIGSTVIGSASAVGTTNKFSTTAVAVTSANHGLVTGNTIIISGATPSGYDCATPCTITRITNTSFSYPVGSKLTPATVVPSAIANGTTTVVATSLVAHGFVAGNSVTISGASPSGYNGVQTVLAAPAPTATTFAYSTSTVLTIPSGTITAGTSTSSTVSATTTASALHGFAAGISVVIESTSSPADGNHPGTWPSITTPTTTTFTYDTGSALPTPTGNFTVRPAVISKAYVTLANHGYSDNDQILITGASPAGYNGIKTITVLDANTFTYPLTGPLGSNIATGVTASKATNLARATSVAHGFANLSSVQITGATPNEFNGTYTINVIDGNNFTYALGSAQGAATGTVNAIQAGGGGRDDLIRWVRGEDNFQDENANGSSTDIRASIHGDVLHSRPAVINYNRYGSDNDVYVYYGANDGIFRAVKGGYATDGSATVQIAPGQEAWGFIPPEFLDELNRLRKNSPIVSSSFKKAYFADGSIGIYTKDTDNNGKLGDAGDIVNIYMSMRRGGRFIYALDVNNPHDPKYLWKIDNASTGFTELGQTWSQPTVITGLAGYPDPVLVFGAGYDSAVEDIVPTTITASTSSSVSVGATTINRSMGRGIYVVNALTGALLWRSLGAGTPAADTKIVSGMDYAIPSDVTIIKNETGGTTNRGYVGDTGGNVWRVDFSYDAVNGWANTLVTKIGDVGGSGVVKRKFLYPPDVVGAQAFGGFDAVLIGAGDREHPFDISVENRFYMFKDFGNDSGPVTGTAVATPTIVESEMFDATPNCIQNCLTAAERSAAVTALNAKSGWYITLGTGEKVVGNALSLGGTTFFNTNQPDSGAGGGACGSNLGIARQYQVSTTDATATQNLDGTPGNDRSVVVAGGGYLPPPVHVVVEIGGKIVEAVISGITVTEPPGVTLAARLRKFWYKEID